VLWGTSNIRHVNRCKTRWTNITAEPQSRTTHAVRRTKKKGRKEDDERNEEKTMLREAKYRREQKKKDIRGSRDFITKDN